MLLLLLIVHAIVVLDIMSAGNLLTRVQPIISQIDMEEITVVKNGECMNLRTLNIYTVFEIH